MDQEKIGKLIAMCRKEKKLTQIELADKLGVTDKSVSKWETGKCLPDVSLYKKLCEILGITLNDFFAGEIISESNYKKVSDSNLLIALENSTFTLKDKIKYYKNKWLKEHLFDICLCIIALIVLMVALKVQNVENYLIVTIEFLLAFIFYITKYNQMMKFIENNAYSMKK